MPRLVDYVVLVGYDFDRSSGGESQGRIVQRFPTKSWDDYPYEFHLEAFCQPCGWQLVQNRLPPTFFVAYLTDVVGNPYFAACLTFHEAVTPQQLNAAERLALLNSSTTGSGSHHRRTATQASHMVNGSVHHLRLAPSKTSPTTGSLYSSESAGSYEVQGQLFGRTRASSTGLNVQNFDRGDPNLIRPAELYAPKCLVLLARHNHFDVLKNSLSVLYTVFADSLRQYSLEHIVATLLGAIDVPPPGGPRISFSLGAGDRQTIQPAHCTTIPVTRNYVALLFRHLGIHNVILLFSAILSDQKVLLCSRSLNRLTESCQALTAILYPLKYGHTFVPILPKCLIEYLNAPTPFLYGIHSDYRHLLPDLLDVFVVDLDGGSVACPENLPVPQLPEPYFNEVVESLFQILSPELLTADHVYPPKPHGSMPDLVVQDKQLRAVFVRLFASLFSGYRSCLSITRIHPQPVIHFNQSLFIMLRTISSHNEFFERLLSSMRFQQFILERGPPFRVCDVFDEVCDAAQPPERQRTSNLGLMGTDDDEDVPYPIGGVRPALDERLSQKLLENECGEKQIEHILPDEAIEAHKRIHQTPFPFLDSRLVDQLTYEASQRKNKTSQYQKSEPRFVPQGHILDRQLFKAVMFPDKNRVLREFIADIFNQHITEALKRRNTIRQDLKSRPIRRLFVDELQRCLIPVPNMSPSEAINDLANNTDRCLHEQRALLTWEQFELIVDLLDEALCQESQSEDTGIAPIVMELSTKFCTQLNNVRYYANMTHQIQRHHVWEQMSFWESVFNEHVNSQIRQLYLHFSEQEQQQQQYNQQRSLPSSHQGDNNTEKSFGPSPNENGMSPPTDTQKGERVITVGIRRKFQPSYTANMSALEIAAEEMRLVNSRPADVQQSLEVQEESTVYAQIIHFINLIVNFRIPVDVGAAAASVYGDPSALNNFTGTVDSNHVDYAVNMHDTAFGSTHRVHQKENGIISDGDRSTVDVGSNWRPRYTDLVDRLPISSGHPTSRHPSPGDLRRDPHRSQHDRGMNVGSALEYISALEAWIRRFVEKVTDENSLISHRTAKIHEKIEGVIEGHLLNLETIYPEVKNIPKTKKPEIANPTLLASEVAIPIGGYDCVRCQLLVDGRLERTDCQLLDALGDLSAAGSGAQNGPDKSGPAGSPVENEFEVDAMLRPLLPAQGALFVTNYRIIFTGVPKDPYQSNKVITRSFPIAALHSIKKLGVMRITTVFPATTSAQPNPYAPSQRRAGTLFTVKRSRAAGPMSKRKGGYRGTSASGGGVEVGGRKGLVRFDENLDVIALRALTLQLLKLGFDPDEITPDTRDELRSLLNELRYPSTLRMGFNSPPFGLSLTPTITHLKPELDSRLSMTRTDSVGPYKPAKYERRNSVSSIQSTVIGELLPARQASLGASYQTTGSSGIRVSPEQLATGSRYANDAATAIAVVLSSSVVSRIDTRLVKLIINSPGYLDMARFGLGSAPSSTSSTMNTGPGSSGYQSGCAGAVGSSSNRLSVLMHSNLAYSNGARLVAYNARYELTKSYPTLLVIPASINHSCLNKLARSYRQGRFPVVTWQHPQNGAYLFRGSGFHSKSILGALKHVGSSGPTANPVVDKDGSEESGEQATSHTSSSKEHARYLLALVDMSFGAMSAAGFSNIGQPSSTGSDSMYGDREHISASMNTSTTIVSPVMEPGQHHRRSNHTLAVSNAFQFSGGKTRSLGRIAGIAMGQYRGRGTPMGSMASGLEVDTSSTASSSQVHIRGGGSPRNQSSRTQARVSGVTGTVNPMAAALYLLGERSMMKNLAKHSSLRSVEFVPVDFFSYSAIADSFKILFKACLPHDLGKSCGTGGSIGSQNSPPDLDPIGAGFTVSGGGGGGSGGTSSAGGSGGGGGGTNSVNVTGQTSASLQTANIHTAINDSGWLIQIQSLLQLAGAVVYLLDTQGASVALCLEDGTDAVTQTVALAQIMLDPHYRTLAGFWALVEKEWLLFGHRFNQRLNQTVNSKADPVSPVFLQFLDAVHQLLRQFPLSFEFNDFFLQFLAHHHISNRFHNFKYDNEAERVNAWLDVNEGLNRNFSAPACITNNAVSASSATTTTTSVAGSEQDKLLQQYDQHSIWTYIQRQHDEWPVFFNFRYSQQMGEKTLRPATNLASLDIWQFYLSEDLATGPTYDLDHFSPSYRKQNNRPYEPILRQGFNNTHVEQTYAVLGLREGEEAIGWRRAWEQAQEEVNFYPQVPPVRRRMHRLIIDSSTATRSGKPSESSSKTSGLHELINPNRLTITMDFREGSEPANSLTAMNTDTLFAPPPRRALSGAMNDLSHPCINHTTLTPQRAAGMKSSGEPVGASSDPSFRVDSNLNRTAKAKDDLPQVVNGLITNGKAVRIVRVHPTHSLTSESEDEAFHDDGLEEAYTEPDDLGSDIDSLDDCMAARSAAMDDHRAATLRRLTRRPLRLTQNSELLSQPSLETGLSSGFGNESDSLTSGSVYSSNQPKSAVLSTVATVDEIATSTLMFSTPHKFVQATVSMSNVRCQYCQNILLSFSTGRTAARCTQCSYLCHEKCAPLVPKYCRPGGRPSPSATIPNSSDPTSSHTSLRQHSMLSGLHEEEQNSDRARLAGFLSPKPPWRTTHESTRNSEPISRNSAIQVCLSIRM